MSCIPTLAVACLLALAVPRIAATQQRVPGAAPLHIDSALAAQAKITLDSARVIALARVPHGTVASEELERENGHLIYSFDVKVPNRSGIQEVNVNALTGAVLGVHHENAAAEQREARLDSTAARKHAAHTPSH